MNDSLWHKLIHYGLEYFGKFYSTYRGFVVDNDDPEKMNRVKVILPSIYPNDKEGVWAYPKNNWGGKDYGINLLPLKNDMIFLEFDHGDLDYPIWSHAGYGQDEKPEEFSKTYHYGFKTPNKNLILIDDGTNGTDGSILVKFKSGETYSLKKKDLFELESTLIKLGKRGDEWAVMGETLKAKLEEILYIQQQNQTFLAMHTHTTAAPYAPTGVPIQTTNFIDVRNVLQDIYNSLIEILSQKVKIDK